MTLQPVMIDTAPSNAPSDVSAGDLLTELRQLLDKRDEVNLTVAAINERRNQVEYELQKLAERTGLDSFSNDVLTVSVKTETVVGYDPEYWGSLMEWAVRTNNTHIIQRRVSTRPVMELVDNGIEMPEGIKFETITKVNTRRK